jgi:DNA-binding SARP family transcriptional activator
VLGERIEADLELGSQSELVDELEALNADHPLNERFRGLLMLTLYREDRRADALAASRRLPRAARARSSNTTRGSSIWIARERQAARCPRPESNQRTRFRKQRPWLRRTLQKRPVLATANGLRTIDCASTDK